MKIIKTKKGMTGFVKLLKSQGRSISFVPTMGCLHEGHISLVREAVKKNQACIVSIFVNPLQFNSGEDLGKYPRDFKHDLSLLNKLKVAALFFPSSQEMYLKNSATYVNEESLTKTLCGKSRPGHFRGVSTVVLKLFNIVEPDIAYFGEKDRQQLLVIKKLVRDLDLKVKIKGMPIIREKDGLALSSRNKYLNSKQRAEALVLHQSLKYAEKLVRQGEVSTFKICKEIEKRIKANKSCKIDYISIVDLETLQSIKKITGKALLALAVWVGKARLIDNTVLNSKSKIKSNYDQDYRMER